MHSKSLFQVRSWLLLGCCVSLTGLTGCGGTGKLTPVEGKVKLGNTVLTQGQVTFYPVGDKSGVAKTIVGNIDSSGSYKMTTNGQAGVPAGEYTVTVNTIVAPSGGAADISKGITAPPTGSAGPVRLANESFESATTSTLKMVVPSASYDLTVTK